VKSLSSSQLSERSHTSCGANALRVVVLFVVTTALMLCAATLPARAHETDQYTLPAGRQFVDLGEEFDAFFYNAIDRGVQKLNARIRADLAAKRDPSQHHTADAAAFAVNGEFPIALFLIEDLDKKMTSISSKDRWPGGLPGYKPPPSMYKFLLYPLNPFRAWNCATIKVYGVYLGTDKVGHFTDMGMHYYRTYSGYRKKGESHDQALRRAIGVGAEDPIKSESGLLGYWTAGAYSNADLAINYLGMQFYMNLTQPQMLKGELRPAMLVRDGQYWKIAPHVRRDSQFMSYFFTEHCDEALNPSRYLPGMRDGIRKLAVDNASSILEMRLDRYGNRHSQQYFLRLSRDLRTLWGTDYGHRGTDDELILVTDACFPRESKLPKDATSRDAFGRTALHIAAEAGETHRVQQLLAAGADVDAQVRSDENRNSDWGNTPLHLAALNGHEEVVRLLVSRRANVNAASDRGATPLHLAVEHPQVMRQLLAAGANVNARDAQGRTPLHWAAMGGAYDAVALLSDGGGGADLNARDRDGRTPMYLAAQSRSAGAVAELARHGADLNLGDTFGVTPLHVACHTAALDVAEVLVNAGAALDAQDQLSCTPLHEATRNRAEGVVAMLLEAGASPTVSDAFGTTPLHLASRYGDQVVARLLLARGADTHVRAGSRGTPIDEAVRAGHASLVTILRDDESRAGTAGAAKRQ
jgi:ankyrin repeat protein